MVEKRLRPLYICEGADILPCDTNLIEWYGDSITIMLRQ